MRSVVLISAVVFQLTTQATAVEMDAPRARDAFVSADGIRLHYVDWGGKGQVLLFLTPHRKGAPLIPSIHWLQSSLTDFEYWD